MKSQNRPNPKQVSFNSKRVVLSRMYIRKSEPA